ncbi:MAG: hypothetical protein IMZ50_16480 [Candidatus Atribacteria bacterium]|nr:hypothetical protein [Candidatus Atribacteria bacterium]
MKKDRKRPNQCDTILEELKRMHRAGKGTTLTVRAALLLFDVYALSQRIGELVKRGIKIEFGWKTLISGARVRTYRLTRRGKR